MSITELSSLESWLWDSANILRGSIDSSDFKNYIFGLLFLKRSSDVFEDIHFIWVVGGNTWTAL